MNPLFRGSGYGIGDVIRLYKQAKQNPAMVSNLLYQNGRIDQNQMQAMNGMTPQQMGQYMANNGIMNQRFLSQGQQYTDTVKHNMT